jgi:hypothetical protein
LFFHFKIFTLCSTVPMPSQENTRTETKPNVSDLEVEHDVVVEHVKIFENRRARHNDATNSHEIKKRAGAH